MLERWWLAFLLDSPKSRADRPSNEIFKEDAHSGETSADYARGYFDDRPHISLGVEPG